MRDELPEERPDRATRESTFATAGAAVTGTARTAERVQRVLVDAKRWQVTEQRAAGPAGARYVDETRRVLPARRGTCGRPGHAVQRSAGHRGAVIDSTNCM